MVFVCRNINGIGAHDTGGSVFIYLFFTFLLVMRRNLKGKKSIYLMDG